MSNRWIRCIECNKVAHVTDYDRSPQYQYDRDFENSIEKPMDDMKPFMMQHERHNMEELSVIKDSFISEGKYGEPRKESYFQATNGKEQFVIRGWREDINAPLQYELIPGYIKTTISLKVQSHEIQRQMREEMKTPPIAETKIEQFIQIVERVASQFSRRDEIEITAETDTPLVSHCKMDSSAIGEILSLSREIFDAGDVKKVERFIHQNNNCNGPMTLLLKRTFTVKRERSTAPESEEEPLLLDGVTAERSSR